MTQNLNAYWQSEFDRKKREDEYSKLQSDIEHGLAKNSTKEKFAALEAENEALKQSLKYSQMNAGFKEKELKEKEEYYKDLLTKDFHEIAKISGGTFLENYHEQQTLLGEWMVSQRAFKELAIRFGLESGNTKEEVLSERENTEIKVLNNETEYGNDFGSDNWEIFYAPKIKAKLNYK
jgi:hypothetical protein